MDLSTLRPKMSFRCFITSMLLIMVLCFTSVYRESRSLLLCSSNVSINTRDLESGVSTSSYKLASMESYGYFDDIDDATWIRQQQRARTDPIYYQPTNPNMHSNDVARWILFNVDPMFTCPNLLRVGGRGDGPKWTCDPHRLVQKPDCLIYSIGSRGIYRFEDGIVSTLKENDPMSNVTQNGEWLPNCEIHVFDPSPNYGRVGDEKNNIHYHAIGLKSSYVPFSYGSFPKTSEFLSFQDIQKRLGHENRRVDIFKIDCEGCELSTYKDWLHPDVDVRQVLVETHGILKEPNLFFDRFLDMGLVPFSKEANTHPMAKPTGQLFEWGFVKLHPNFLRRSTNLMSVKFE